MAVIKGQNMRLYINGRVIASAISANLVVQAVATESATKDTENGWSEKHITAHKWQVSSEAVLGFDTTGLNTQDLIGMVGQEVSMHFSTTTGKNNAEEVEVVLNGIAIISDMSIRADNKRRGTVSILLTGRSRLGIPKILCGTGGFALRTKDGKTITVA